MRINFIVNPDYIRKIKFPSGRQTYHIYPLLTDYRAGNIPSEINPRSHKPDTVDGKKIDIEIEKTLSDDPEFFDLINRGCFIHAARVNYNPETRVCELDFDSDDSMFGMPDGKTTDRALQRIQGEGQINLDHARVHLEIVVGLKNRDEIRAVAEGRNTSIQVKDISLLNFSNEFQWIKSALKGKPYAGRIGYEENAEGDVSVRDILSYIHLLVSSTPVQAYSSKGSVIDSFMADKPKYMRMAPFLGSILEMRDYVEEYIPYVINGMRGGCLGGRRGHKVNLHKQANIFSGRVPSHIITEAVLFPILISLRPLLEIKDGKPQWKFGLSPEEFFLTKTGETTLRTTAKRSVMYEETYGSQIINQLYNQLDEIHEGQPNVCGKSRSTYQAMIQYGENFVKDEEIKRLRAQVR
jgi:hypothetical protein